MVKFNVKNVIRNKKLLICIIVALVIIAIIVSIIWTCSDKLNSALKLKKFNCVQIKISQSIDNIDISSDSNSADSSKKTSANSGKQKSSNETRNKSSDGNESTVSVNDNNKNTSSNSHEAEINTVEKYNDIIYEDGKSGKVYYYKEGGKDYVTYYDNYYGINEKKGTWIKNSANHFGLAQSFDFKALCKYKKKDFMKTEDVYILKGDANATFCNLFNIENVDKYAVGTMEFQFDKGTLLSIKVKYVYDSKYSISQTYKFEYEKISLTVPKAGKINK